jgi:hypothetical protein
MAPELAADAFFPVKTLRIQAGRNTVVWAPVTCCWSFLKTLRVVIIGLVFEPV